MEFFNRISTWSNLATIGNSPIAKSVILLPVVAYALKLNGDFIEEYFGLNLLLWFYWSLLLIWIAQVLYMRYCPRQIKNHPNKVESFVAEARNTYPTSLFRNIRWRVLKSYLEGDKKLTIDVNSVVAPIQKTSSDKDKAEYALSALNKWLSSDYKPDFGIPYPKKLIKFLLQNPKRMDRGNNFPNVGELKKHVHHFASLIPQVQYAEGPDEDSTRAVLIRQYKLLNEQSAKLRNIIFLLYGTGSIYFIWQALRNLNNAFRATYQYLFT